MSNKINISGLRAKIRKLYIKQKKSMFEVGLCLGVSEKYVYDKMDEFGIKKRSRLGFKFFKMPPVDRTKFNFPPVKTFKDMSDEEILEIRKEYEGRENGFSNRG